MPRRLTLLLGLAATVLAPGRSAAGKPLYLLVTTPALVKALEPLAEHRKADGFEVVISTDAPDKAIAHAKAPAMLLLVGDDESLGQKQPWYVPAQRLKQFRWMPSRQREQYVSDAAWGDLDGDGLPDIPVGRLPARQPAQVKTMVDKIIAYEKAAPSPTDLSAAVWAGSPCYDPRMDSMATGIVLNALQANAPAWLEPWVLTGDPSHVLCGVPTEQPALFAARVRRGGVMSVFIGHGGERSLHSMTSNGESVGFRVEDVARHLSKGQPGAPMVMICCLSASFADNLPCLAEELLLAHGGPVAAIGATTESHPLPNYFTGVRLVRGLSGSEPRLGPMWLAAQRSAMKDRNFLIEQMLKDVEGAVSSEDLPKLRRDQLLIYALLGDPATRLRLPQPMKATVQSDGAAGWRWKVDRPAGAARLTVCFRPAGQAMPAVSGQPSANDARRLFDAANATMAMPVVKVLEGDAPWEGTADRPGRLRLVADGGGRLFAATAELKPDADAPATKGQSAAGGNIPPARMGEAATGGLASE